MEKLPERYNLEVGPLLLYLEDLDRVCELMSQGGRKFEVIADRYRFENVNEFRDLKMDSISKLEFNSYSLAEGNLRKHAIFLELYRWKTGSLWGNEPSEATWGLCAQIEQYLNQHKRLPDPVPQFIIAVAAAFVAFASLYWGLLWRLNQLHLPHDSSLIDLCIFLASLIYFCVFLVASKYFARRSAIIILKERRQRRSFAKRHGEAITATLISSVLTAVIVTPITIAITRSLASDNRNPPQAAHATTPTTNP